MSSIYPDEKIVMEGTYLYDNTIECDIRIVYSPIRFGSVDYEDPPEIQNDQEIDTYLIEYGSTTKRGYFNARGGGYNTLEEAMESAKKAPGIGPSIKWNLKE